MLAINDNKKICIFSKGKTGTTSLQNLLENNADWKTVGEAEVDWYGIGSEHFAGISRQEDIVEHLHKQDYEIFFVIRNPWQRYVSGFKEILQDYISGIAPGDEFLPLWEKIVYDRDRLVEYIDRLFYLTQFICDGEQELKHSWGRAFTLHTNYHTCNFIDFCEQFKNISYIDSSNLDWFIKEVLELEPGVRMNTSKPRDIDSVRDALLNCKHYYLIDKYLKPEIARYENIM